VGSPSKRVLITGIDGFTGRYLERLLEDDGYEVCGLSFPDCTRANHTRCDITKKDDVISALDTIRPDYIVHLAAITFVPNIDIPMIYGVNLFGTLNILDAVLKLGLDIKKTVIASSANVYGNPDLEVLEETVCPAPINHYANSKLAMENMVKTYFDKVNIIITRPFNYTGAGQPDHFLIPKIVRHFKEGKKEIELGNLDVIRDFSDVRFVADAYKKLIESDAVSEIVNICSGTGTSLLSIIDIMNGLAGYEISVTVNPEFIRKNDIKKLIGSNKKLFNMVEGLHIYSIDDILKNMYNS
jgi:nucleoside-diphosphate-sugar epimerase